MRSLRFVVAIAAVLVAGVSATSSAAATATPVSIKLVEPLQSGMQKDCPDIWTDFNCGTGLMKPFGQAKSEALIGICGDTCNIRIITVASGTIVLRETVSDVSCPGACASQGTFPFHATFTAEVIDGNGAFAGATGSLSGSLSVGGWEAQIEYSGVVTLAG
jgi:hypothetical protein